VTACLHFYLPFTWELRNKTVSI